MPLLHNRNDIANERKFINREKRKRTTVVAIKPSPKALEPVMSPSSFCLDDDTMTGSTTTTAAAGSSPQEVVRRPRCPEPWKWTCHRCRRTWRMGTTQRCLHCGHRMCIGKKAQKRVREEEKEQERKRRKKMHNVISNLPPSLARQSRPRPPHSSIPATATARAFHVINLLKKKAESARQEKQAKQAKMTKEQRAAAKMCASYFDFEGWKNWNAWRRHFQGGSGDGEYDDTDSDTLSNGDDATTRDDNDDGGGGENEATSSSMTIRPTQGRLHVVSPRQESAARIPLHRDCWNNCNYPSQCKVEHLLGKYI